MLLFLVVDKIKKLLITDSLLNDETDPLINGSVGCVPSSPLRSDMCTPDFTAQSTDSCSAIIAAEMNSSSIVGESASIVADNATVSSCCVAGVVGSGLLDNL